jgi:hypothetical protein
MTTRHVYHLRTRATLIEDVGDTSPPKTTSIDRHALVLVTGELGPTSWTREFEELLLTPEQIAAACAEGRATLKRLREQHRANAAELSARLTPSLGFEVRSDALNTSPGLAPTPLTPVSGAMLAYPTVVPALNDPGRDGETPGTAKPQKPDEPIASTLTIDARRFTLAMPLTTTWSDASGGGRLAVVEFEPKPVKAASGMTAISCVLSGRMEIRFAPADPYPLSTRGSFAVVARMVWTNMMAALQDRVVESLACSFTSARTLATFDDEHLHTRAWDVARRLRASGAPGLAALPIDADEPAPLPKLPEVPPVLQGATKVPPPPKPA